MATDRDSVSQDWLTREDDVCRQDRLARLNWLAKNSPHAEFWIFPGGLMSKYLFEEARYCFAYGQFLAAIVLGLAYIEHTLAGLFYEGGRDDLERASVSKLLQEALEHGWISQVESDGLEHARRIRNSITHFRRPGHDEGIEFRAVTQTELPYTLIEEDARHVMEAVLHLLEKQLF